MDGDSFLRKSVAWAPLVLRVAVGTIFIGHGAQKLFGAFGGPGMPGIIAGFAHSGIHPAVFWAWVVSLVEFFGGLGLFFGLLTSLSAIGLIVDMIVAVALVHGKNGFFLPRGFEYNFALIAMMIAILLSGAGPYSFDRLIRWRY